MSTLFLLRHAKAGWALPGMRDFDRPLDRAGHAEAQATGEAMRTRGYLPEVTLCSNAKRARETFEDIAAQVDTGRVLHFDRLYSDDAAGYLDLVRRYAEESVLVIGHNPMMEDLAAALSGAGEPAACAALGHGFPTSALAVIGFDRGFAEAAPGAGYLQAFLTPADL